MFVWAVKTLEEANSAANPSSIKTDSKAAEGSADEHTSKSDDGMQGEVYARRRR